jgi:hypothetical protein
MVLTLWHNAIECKNPFLYRTKLLYSRRRSSLELCTRVVIVLREWACISKRKLIIGLVNIELLCMIIGISQGILLALLHDINMLQHLLIFSKWHDFFAYLFYHACFLKTVHWHTRHSLSDFYNSHIFMVLGSGAQVAHVSFEDCYFAYCCNYARLRNVDRKS